MQSKIAGRGSAAQAQKSPDALFAGSSNVDEVIRAMKQAMEAGGKDGDITGAGLFGDIGEFIGAIGDFLKSEKPFFFDILKLLLCGCKGDGW